MKLNRRHSERSCGPARPSSARRCGPGDHGRGRRGRQRADRRRARCPQDDGPPVAGRSTRDRLARLDDAPRIGRVPTYGRAMSAQAGIGITAIQRIWAAAVLTPDRGAQVLHRPRPGDQGPRCCRAPPCPTRAGDRGLPRREDPDPGPRSDPAHAADAPRAGRAPHPRLRAQRRHLPVRRARGRHRAGQPPRRGCVTGARTSSPSCGRWSRPTPMASCTSSSTTSAPTRRRLSGPGSIGTPGSRSTSPRPRRPG